MKQMQMNQPMKQITCDPACGFMVRSHDEKEVVDLAMQHVKHAHPDIEVTKEDMNERMKTVRE